MSIRPLVRPALIGLLMYWTASTHASDPTTLLGTPLPAPDALRTAAPMPRLPMEDKLDDLLALPSRTGIESLLNARVVDLTRRGSKEIAINRRVAPATVFLQQGTQTCTGSIITPDGKILTSWHCVRGKGAVDVRLHPQTGKRTTLARVVRSDRATDLALLQITEQVPGLLSLPLGEPNDLEIGADVYAIGHPLGLNWSFVKGLVSQVYEKRVWNFESNRHEAGVVQAQIDLFPGNSGGPLVSEKGQLVGVNSHKHEGDKFAFAISLDDVRRFLAQGGEMGSQLARTAETVRKTECLRKELARGRNPDNTGTVILYDTNCDGRADVQIMALDGAAEDLVIAAASDGSGRIDMVRAYKTGGVSTYLSNTPKQQR